MNDSAQLISVLTSICLLSVLFDLLRRKRLRERHIAWWFIGGFIALFFSIFPQALFSITHFLGFELPANLVFFAATTLLFLVSIQSSAELTQLEEKTRILAEKIALLENQNSKNKETD